MPVGLRRALPSCPGDVASVPLGAGSAVSATDGSELSDSLELAWPSLPNSLLGSWPFLACARSVNSARRLVLCQPVLACSGVGDPDSCCGSLGTHLSSGRVTRLTSQGRQGFHRAAAIRRSGPEPTWPAAARPRHVARQ